MADRKPHDADGDIGREIDPEIGRLLAEDEAGDPVLTAWLAALPPEGPPAGFFVRMDAALGITPPRRVRTEAPPARDGRVRGAARAASWAVRGPASGLPGTGSMDGLRAGFSGLSAARYVLGPLAPKRRPKKRKRPLWQRALGFGG